VARTAVALLATVAALGIGELGLRAYDAYTLGPDAAGPGASPIFVRTDAPHGYELRPRVRRYRGRIDINSLGLRGPEIPQPALDDEVRVLFVGDSVTFAGEVPYEAAFPAKVEDALRRSGDRRLAGVRTLNGGVPGYSPFNELYWLREHGPSLHPDAIVIQFCLNDVVDPLPQWNLSLGYALPADVVPAEAIPNPAAHRRLLWRHALRRFRIVTRLESMLARRTTVRGWPAYVTAEQSVSIEVYSDRRSPEVRWLRRTYMDLIAEARRNAPNVLVLFVPLAYQLSPGYPVQSPQDVLVSIARDNDVPLLDLTPVLRPLGPVRSFRPGTPGAPDIWHLSEEGHAAAAQAIARALRSMLAEKPET
jgi:lysophospholipase L1-like esterase